MMDIYIVMARDKRDIAVGEIASVFTDLFQLAQYDFDAIKGDDEYCYFIVEYWSDNTFVGSFSIPEILDFEEDTEE